MQRTECSAVTRSHWIISVCLYLTVTVTLTHLSSLTGLITSHRQNTGLFHRSASDMSAVTGVLWEIKFYCTRSLLMFETLSYTFVLIYCPSRVWCHLSPHSPHHHALLLPIDRLNISVICTNESRGNSLSHVISVEHTLTVPLLKLQPIS